MALTAKKRSFAEHFLAGSSAAEAARRAGYSPSTALDACKWINPKKPEKFDAELAAYIQERMEEQSMQLVASANEVLQFFTRVMRGEEKDQFGLDAALDARMTAGRELLKRHDAAKDVREARADDGLKRSLDAAARAVCSGCDDSGMLPECDDDDGEDS